MVLILMILYMVLILILMILYMVPWEAVVCHTINLLLSWLGDN